VTIILNHTIIPARRKEEAARWFAEIFCLPYENSKGHFAPVRVNETLTFLFSDEASICRNHYAFHVSDEEFDSVLSRVKSKGLAFGSAPWRLDDRQLNDWNGGRGVYFRSPDGHVLELMTVAQ
jgi:catechol 2,3-dioxygenase-like lactoylglutathione lyase family enzyme